MDWITEHSVIACGHGALVHNVASQGWVTVGGSSALVADDPVGRTIVGCPNVGPTVKPCTKTLRVAAGYSGWIRIDKKSVTLSHLDGLTDGTLPGTVHYRVESVRQSLVRADS
jgi:hypothetical protein